MNESLFVEQSFSKSVAMTIKSLLTLLQHRRKTQRGKHLVLRLSSMRIFQGFINNPDLDDLLDVTHEPGAA